MGAGNLMLFSSRRTSSCHDYYEGNPELSTVTNCLGLFYKITPRPKPTKPRLELAHAQSMTGTPIFSQEILKWKLLLAH